MANHKNQLVQQRCSSDQDQTLHEELGRRIRASRRLRGLTQGEIAKFLGISFQQVQKYEIGRNRISAVSLGRIAPLLGTTVADLLDGLIPHSSVTPGSLNGRVERREWIDPNVAVNPTDASIWQHLSITLLSVLADFANTKNLRHDESLRAETGNAKSAIKTRRRNCLRERTARLSSAHR